MKKSSVVVASLIALFCAWEAFLSPGAVWIDPVAGGVKHVPRLWPLIQAVVASLTVIALMADFVLLAALCAYIIVLVSLISFFGSGLYVSVPATALVILIGMHSAGKPLSRV